MAQILISGATVVTMVGDGVLESADLLVENGQIAAVGRVQASPDAHRIDARGCVVMPGLINAHTHLFQTLLRGFVDGVPLIEWLRQIYGVGPALTPEDCRVSARLGALESLRGGVTTVLEHHFAHPSLEHPAATIEGLREAGIRAVVARTSMDVGELVPSETRETPQEAEAAAGRFLTQHAGGPLLTLMVGPNTPPINASIDLVKAMHRVARRHGVRITTHCAEGQTIVAHARTLGASGVVDLLERAEVLGSEWLASHCVHLADEEIQILRRRGVSVAHNPVSNMFLGDGIAPLRALRRAGIPVSLGTDGPASNNTLDMFEVMKLTSLLHRVAALDAAAIRPIDVLRMATVDGARTLGLDGLVGSLEVGKRADIITIDLARPHLVALHDLQSHLVHCVRASDVRDVVVDGRIVMRNRVVQTLAEETVLEDARVAARRLAESLRGGRTNR